jgi:hypothetical protein
MQHPPSGSGGGGGGAQTGIAHRRRARVQDTSHKDVMGATDASHENVGKGERVWLLAASEKT